VALPRDPAGVVEGPGPWQHKHVAANGARFHVVEALPGDHVSDAPLVLLLHGFPEFWWTWRHLLPVLAQHGYRAVAMDLRGYGGSDKPPRGYDPITLAGDVAGVIKALGERSAVVVGHDWGGYVGWAAAALHPGQVTGLCAVAAPHPLVMLGLLRLSSARMRGLLGHLVAAQAPFVPERRLSRPTSSYVADHLRDWSSPASPFPDEDTTRRYQEALSLWPAAHCALEYHRWLLRSRLRADGRRFASLMRPPVGVPLCLVHGSDDPVVPRSAPRRSRNRVAAPSEAHELPGTGHFPHEEDPVAFAAVLLSWLAEVQPVRAPGG
jgi:pimeloyl-ACP methyl ester carboxylesterase